MKTLITIRTFRLLMIALLLVSVTACSDQDLSSVAQSLDTTAKAISVFQTTVINANAAHLLSDTQTRQLLQATIRVNAAGEQAVLITRKINALAPADRSNLLAILSPVISSLSDTQSNVVAAIADVRTRETIQAGLLLIQTALNGAQVILAAKTN